MAESEKGPSPAEMGINQEKKEGDPYHEKTEVDGIEISVGWDEGYNEYILFLPQVEIGNDRGVSDQIMVLGDSPEVAKQVYDYAVSEASNTEDVYDLYKKCYEFSEPLREKQYS